MAFLVDNEIEFDLPGLPATTTHYKWATEAVEVALASELKVTGQFNTMTTSRAGLPQGMAKAAKPPRPHWE